MLDRLLNRSYPACGRRLIGFIRHFARTSLIPVTSRAPIPNDTESLGGSPPRSFDTSHPAGTRSLARGVVRSRNIVGSGGAGYCQLRLPVRPSDPEQPEGGLSDAADPSECPHHTVTRAEIARSHERTGVLAQRYGVSTETIRKWRKRGAKDYLDHSPGPVALKGN